MARKRRRLTAEFKGRVALGALRERDSVQAITARNKLHVNQVSARKRQLLDAVPKVFAQGTGGVSSRRSMSRRSTTCTRRSGSSRSSRIPFGARSDAEPGGADADDRVGRTAEPVEAVRAAGHEPVVAVLPAEGRGRGESGADTAHGRDCTWSTLSTGAGI